MARGTQFGELVDMLRAELEQSLNRNVGLNALDGLKYRLRNSYSWLWTNFDWPHLKVYRKENLQVGQRQYAFPSDLVYEDVETVDVYWGGRWVPVRQGITPADYNVLAEGERADPACRWDVREDDMYEVWPTPLTATELRMYGKKKFVPLVDESDRCELDDLAIVLFAAASALARAKSADAQMTADKAVAHLNKLRAKQRSNKTRAFVMGGGVTLPALRPGIDYIPKA